MPLIRTCRINSYPTVHRHRCIQSDRILCNTALVQALVTVLHAYRLQPVAGRQFDRRRRSVRYPGLHAYTRHIAVDIHLVYSDRIRRVQAQVYARCRRVFDRIARPVHRNSLICRPCRIEQYTVGHNIGLVQRHITELDRHVLCPVAARQLYCRSIRISHPGLHARTRHIAVDIHLVQVRINCIDRHDNIHCRRMPFIRTRRIDRHTAVHRHRCIQSDRILCNAALVQALVTVLHAYRLQPVAGRQFDRRRRSVRYPGLHAYTRHIAVDIHLVYSDRIRRVQAQVYARCRRVFDRIARPVHRNSLICRPCRIEQYTVGHNIGLVQRHISELDRHVLRPVARGQFHRRSIRISHPGLRSRTRHITADIHLVQVKVGRINRHDNIHRRRMPFIRTRRIDRHTAVHRSHPV